MRQVFIYVWENGKQRRHLLLQVAECGDDVFDLWALSKGIIEMMREIGGLFESNNGEWRVAAMDSKDWVDVKDSHEAAKTFAPGRRLKLTGHDSEVFADFIGK
jgi:hypothetical protein